MWSIEETTRRIRQVDALPYGHARTSASEWIVRTLEAEGPQEKLPQALLSLVDSYNFGTKTPNIFAVFSRVLRIWDEHPEYFDEYDQYSLFWEYKWVAARLISYHQISKEQGQAFLDDMRKRFLLAGHSSAAVDEAEFEWTFHLGDFEAADRWKANWLAHGEDPMSCSSCRSSSIAGYLIAKEKYEEALALGMPSTFNCNRQPSTALRYRALAYLELGRGKEARECLGRAIATKDPKFFDMAELAEEFEILARGGQIKRALRMIQDKGSKGFKDEEGCPGDNLSWLLSLISGLSAAMDQPDLSVGDMTVAQMRAQAISRAKPLVAAFDQRAGTTHQSEKLERALHKQQAALLPYEELDDLSFSSLSLNSNSERNDTVIAADRESASSADRLVLSSAPCPDGSSIPPAFSGQAETTLDASADDFNNHEECYQRADRHLNQKDYFEAARWYAAAGQGREKSGLLAESGMAWADCAQCYANLEEYSVACEVFTQAWDLLAAGGASADVLVAVLQAWGASAEKVNRVSELQEPVLTLEKIFLRQNTDFSLPPDFFTDSQSDSPQAAHFFFAELKRKNEQCTDPLDASAAKAKGIYASFLDLNARVLAASTTASSEELGKNYEKATQLALHSAGLFAELGMLGNAGQSLAIAGDLQQAYGDINRAMWSYQLAIESFSLAHRSEARAGAMDSYIQLLKSTGQHALLDEVLAQFLG